MSRTSIAVTLVVALLLFGGCGGSGPGGTCEEGEIETESGLKYEDLECGEGDEASRGDAVNVEYTGMLEDGTEFDSGTVPFQIGSGLVIPGWDEGVPGMKVGGVRRLTIPPELAYGAQGDPPTIPPNATLIFEIELLEIAGT